MSAARAQEGVEDPVFRMDLPATCERIRMACADAFVARVVDGDAPPPPPLKGAERVGRAAHFQARASV